MPDIFISYSREDRSRAEPLAKALEKKGWKIRWDRTIPPGKSFDQVIQEAITAAKCVVVLWSKHSIISDWVKEEATIGKRRQILVPAKIDPVEPPLGFGMIQAADLTDWETETSHAGFAGFLSAISEIVGPPTLQEKSKQRGEFSESSLEKQLELQGEVKETPQPNLRQPERAKVKHSESKPEATATTEPKSPEPRKAINALKFSAVAGVIVLLIVGIWLYISESPKKKLQIEVKSKLENILNGIAILEKNVAKIEKPVQLDDLYGQKYSLDQQAGIISEQASKAGLEPQLEEISNRLERIKIQLTNKVTKNSIDMEFVLIPAGSFTMGSKPGIGEANEHPAHTVEISRPFYLQKTEVTQGQWTKVMGDNPSSNKCGDDCPVENISWDDTREFIKQLNSMELTSTYRLPTEAEWEYACRAGTTTLFFFGYEIDKLRDYAWFSSNSYDNTQSVGTKKPNPWGLYDMYGNVWEWCQDWYNSDYYTISPKKNPEGPQTGHYRVARGSSHVSDARRCRSAVRDGFPPGEPYGNFGFRLARSVAFDH